VPNRVRHGNDPSATDRKDERDEDGKAQQRERASQTVSDPSSPFLAIDIRGPTSLTFEGLLLTPRLEARLQCPNRLRHRCPIGVLQVNLDVGGGVHPPGVERCSDGRGSGARA
jgi:hypothetical protein